MLSENEKQEILSVKEKGGVLPENLKTKFIESLKNGEVPEFNDGDELCCSYRDTTGATQYIWTSFANCRTVHGSAADNSMCGH